MRPTLLRCILQKAIFRLSRRRQRSWLSRGIRSSSLDSNSIRQTPRPTGAPMLNPHYEATTLAAAWTRLALERKAGSRLASTAQMSRALCPDDHTLEGFLVVLVGRVILLRV